MTVWGQRISPVFDAARTLLIVEIDEQKMVDVVHQAFDPQQPLELLRLLRAQDVKLLICGAVSDEPAAMLEAAGIKLIPFITGRVEHVLAHYLLDRRFGSEFCMPGCNRCRRRGMQRGSVPAGTDSEIRTAKDESGAPNPRPTDGGTSCQE